MNPYRQTRKAEMSLKESSETNFIFCISDLHCIGGFGVRGFKVFGLKGLRKGVSEAGPR